MEELIRALPPRTEYFFYRTAAGAEMDFVFISGGKPVGVEITYSLSPQPGKGFWNSFQELGCGYGYVVYPGTERYGLGPRVDALPIARLSEITSPPA
jgi:uncharacterized protein